ncbi:FUSC family protein [Alicyclobacillus ferrooxydans]|uniref:Integral membrane bound transporter domain-containing protein n=1 Tax=Alicyclobacillus ferrooxydans TaxID=471514 RepID=A0A0P9CIL1_9BACL|nr:FUSC family protein [Alicyclobacillus ferrooxydans]KPV45255.1 hypothetical protein AN477_02320 [Alicyclobacillus ferrooxydans]
MLWKRTLRGMSDLTKYDATKLRIGPSLPNAIAIALPLLVGTLTHHPLVGVGVSVGALVSAFSAMAGTSRKRLRTTLFVGAWMAFATFVGALFAFHTLATILLIVFSGFMAGLWTSVSPTAGQVAVLTTNALIIMSQAPQTPLHAAQSAISVLIGGVLQAMLSTGSEWFSREDTETTAVRNVYTVLSNYAKVHTRKADLAVAASLMDAGGALNDSFISKHRWEKLKVLLDLAELIRIDVVALIQIEKNIHNNPSLSQDLIPFIQARLTDVSVMLAFSAKFIRKTDGVADDGMMQEWRQGHNLQIPGLQTTGSDETRRDVLQLMHQLQSKIAQVADVLSSEVIDPAYVVSYSPRRSHLRQFQQMGKTLLANVTFHSTAFRHAIRLAFALAIAATIYRELPVLHRGYWLPLTTMIILKGDFFSTFTRGIGRIVGTFAGVIVASLLTIIPDSSHYLGITLIVVFAWAMYSVLNVNYVLFSFFVTSEIVVLMSFFESGAPGVTITARVLNTLLGSLLAIVVYLIWPTWQRQNVAGTLASLLDSVAVYFRSVATRTPESLTEVESARKHMRTERTNAVSVVDQFLREPVEQILDVHAVTGVLTAVHRFTDTLLALEARVDVHGPLLSQPDIAAWVDRIEHIIKDMEAAVKDETTSISPDIIQWLNETQEFVNQIPSPFIQLQFVRMQENLGTMARMLPLNQHYEAGTIGAREGGMGM